MAPNSCPTVQIQGEPSEGNPSGIVVINESDFDAETMTLAEETGEKQSPAPPVPPIPPAQETSPAKVVAPWAAK